MASTNFKQWNPGVANCRKTTRRTSRIRNGSEARPSTISSKIQLANKLFYQLSTLLSQRSRICSSRKATAFGREPRRARGSSRKRRHERGSRDLELPGRPPTSSRLSRSRLRSEEPERRVSTSRRLRTGSEAVDITAHHRISRASKGLARAPPFLSAGISLRRMRA